MNTKLLKGKNCKMTVDGLNFVAKQPGKTKIIAQAKNEKSMQTMIGLLDRVSDGSMKVGYRMGFKDGMMIGAGVMFVSCAIGAVAMNLREKKKEESEEENEEA